MNDNHHCHEHKAATSHNHTDVSFHAAAHATLHCLTGCVIGEVVGLSIGVTLGYHPYVTMALATILAFLTGFGLSIAPLMRRTQLSFRAALKAIWIGEAISIAVMEIVMNTVDYHMGGMNTGTVLSLIFWQGLAVAIPAGYVAAFPVNYWLIGRQLKKCH